jgi:hypothetical protein
MGALLHRVGNIQIYLDVRSTMISAELNPRHELMLKKKKSRWNITPIGSSVVSLGVPLGILVIPAASQIGHLPGRGANLHGSPGPVISPLSIIS